MELLVNLNNLHFNLLGLTLQFVAAVWEVALLR